MARRHHHQTSQTTRNGTPARRRRRITIVNNNHNESSNPTSLVSFSQPQQSTVVTIGRNGESATQDSQGWNIRIQPVGIRENGTMRYRLNIVYSENPLDHSISSSVEEENREDDGEEENEDDEDDEEEENEEEENEDDDDEEDGEEDEEMNGQHFSPPLSPLVRSFRSASALSLSHHSTHSTSNSNASCEVISLRRLCEFVEAKDSAMVDKCLRENTRSRQVIGIANQFYIDQAFERCMDLIIASTPLNYMVRSEYVLIFDILLGSNLKYLVISQSAFWLGLKKLFADVLSNDCDDLIDIMIRRHPTCISRSSWYSMISSMPEDRIIDMYGCISPTIHTATATHLSDLSGHFQRLFLCMAIHRKFAVVTHLARSFLMGSLSQYTDMYIQYCIAGLIQRGDMNLLRHLGMQGLTQCVSSNLNRVNRFIKHNFLQYRQNQQLRTMSSSSILSMDNISKFIAHELPHYLLKTCVMPLDLQSVSNFELAAPSISPCGLSEPFVPSDTFQCRIWYRDVEVIRKAVTENQSTFVVYLCLSSTGFSGLGLTKLSTTFEMHMLVMSSLIRQWSLSSLNAMKDYEMMLITQPRAAYVLKPTLLYARNLSDIFHTNPADIILREFSYYLRNKILISGITYPNPRQRENQDTVVAHILEIHRLISTIGIQNTSYMIGIDHSFKTDVTRFIMECIKANIGMLALRVLHYYPTCMRPFLFHSLFFQYPRETLSFMENYVMIFDMPDYLVDPMSIRSLLEHGLMTASDLARMKSLGIFPRMTLAYPDYCKYTRVENVRYNQDGSCFELIFETDEDKIEYEKYMALHDGVICKVQDIRKQIPFSCDPPIACPLPDETMCQMLGAQAIAEGDLYLKCSFEEPHLFLLSSVLKRWWMRLASVACEEDDSYQYDTGASSGDDEEEEEEDETENDNSELNEYEMDEDEFDHIMQWMDREIIHPQTSSSTGHPAPTTTTTTTTRPFSEYTCEYCYQAMNPTVFINHIQQQQVEAIVSEVSDPPNIVN